MKPATPKVYNYSGYVLSQRSNGTVDLIDTQTGKWVNSKSTRLARWRATFLNNMLLEMNSQPRQRVPVSNITLEPRKRKEPE